MRVFHGLDQVEPLSVGSVLTIGNFDGVHRAHRYLIATARGLADIDRAAVIVLTFEPHPLAIVAPGREPPRLSTSQVKLERLEQAGADVAVVARSEPALLSMEPEDFVRDVIQAKFSPRHIVEGPSFGFGKGRRGDTDLLRHAAVEFGWTVHVVEPVTVTGDRGEKLLVSSSLIRRLLADGDVARAALCLGSPYELAGTVERGDGRGRTLGFPTANLTPDDQLVPGEGVYAGSASIGQRAYRAAISVGRTPTFDGKQIRVEAHLLEFEGDLYGQPMRITFEQRLRDQMKFPSPDALVRQLERDVAAVKAAHTPRRATVLKPGHPQQQRSGDSQ